MANSTDERLFAAFVQWWWLDQIDRYEEPDSPPDAEQMAAIIEDFRSLLNMLESHGYHIVASGNADKAPSDDR